jgi:hypothetical protein
VKPGSAPGRPSGRAGRFLFRRRLAVFLFFCLFSSLSCGRGKEAVFRVSFPGFGLYGLSQEASSGLLGVPDSQKLDYEFRSRDGTGASSRAEGDLPVIPPGSSLEIVYSVSGDIPRELKDSFFPVLDLGPGALWELPWDASFLGFDESLSPSAYAVPAAGVLEGFSVYLSGAEGRAPPRRRGEEGGAFLRIEGISVVPRRFGFEKKGGGFFASPFVLKTADAFVIDPPPGYRFEDAKLLASGTDFAAGTGNFRLDATGAFSVPFPALGDPFPASASGGLERFVLVHSQPPPFPQPVPADPRIILDYPRESWRDPRYEIFRWENFPSILILDTADYGVQDRLLKRLAFFVEKAGFRGRLASDRELAGLHGWNAHDYRAEDLARFFDTAEKSGFPLLSEERELLAVLFDAGILLRTDGGITDGEGAVISVSRESPGYLRELFMAHEGFHGLFFIDSEFRDFSRSRWNGLSPEARRFILSFFDYQHYDINDEYLVINEFMAHCLQQPASRAAPYFGQTLPGRLAASARRRGDLPPKDEAAGNWPLLARAFRAEAEAFSAYVNERWGFAAGKVSGARR